MRTTRPYLVALADQAAVAAQNSALFGTAAQNATLLERQRLARDLHDSVSQALFSMTLHARAAERHLAAAGLDTGSAAAAEVARLHGLSQGALAEMRALIFELRPGALAEEGLAAALRKQAAAVSAREQVPVDVHVPDRPGAVAARRGGAPLPPRAGGAAQRAQARRRPSGRRHPRPRGRRRRHAAARADGHRRRRRVSTPGSRAPGTWVCGPCGSGRPRPGRPCGSTRVPGAAPESP